MPRPVKRLAACTVAACASFGLLATAGGGTADAATAPAHPFPAHATYKVGVLPSASQSARDAAVTKAYDSRKSGYLVKGCASNEYYVSTKGDDDAPHNGTVSEAQGYGMNIVPLMAGYDSNAKAEFDGLWQLVKVQPHIKLNCANGNVSGDTEAEEAGDSAGPAAMAAGDQAWTDAIWKQLASNPFEDAYYGETIKMLVYVVMAGDYWSPTA